ncbi:MAG: tRNA preQ1(34) S-adenosylmethionine ribosyltransferase-isomerase QueA [Alphaproteobacteria bacterium]|nr:tRNA preQ1(34) S-adenosylmethionine ribosyltransferase-isomerase QueA [Alphaproteobacteria bacterium]
MRTADFDFELPLDRIAQTACEPRDHARLLRIGPERLSDCRILDLPRILKPGDLLVMNNTRVIPARVFGRRGDVRIELLLHKLVDPGQNTWTAFARPGKRLRVGNVVDIALNFCATILEKREGGEILLRFNVQHNELIPLLRAHGEPPLPPYIKRGEGEAKSDLERYQTIYAARDGAVAAPTAGLHFTPELLAALEAMDVRHTMVTLHVGAGTFLPVKAEKVKDHIMHSEWGEISQPVADEINKAKKEGRRIVAVGTTSLRTLESAADEQGAVRPMSRETDIFITPGYRFRAVDALLTNFHLPQSTLFMLVCAFMGMETMRKAYAHAIENNYRFYSYGDACLLEKT